MEQRKKRRRWAFPLGLAIIALALVGTVTLVSLLSKQFNTWIDNPKEKQGYEKFLKNIIMNDPSPFDEVGRANMPQLIDICIWSLLDSERMPKPKEFPPSEDGGVLIPAFEVDAEFARLFGPDVKPLHGTVQGSSYEFVYDQNNRWYSIPVTGMQPIYTPEVVRIDKQGSSVTLTVNYISTDDYRLDDAGNRQTAEPSKTMLVTLYASGNSYIVGAVHAPENQKLPDEGTRAPELYSEAPPEAVASAATAAPPATAGTTAAQTTAR
ncbi:MAG: hypothetical protein LBJ11_04490 [Oscillospiraceae bacterium]|nr:hypothetical protein [Oscillospiraceae bacterium]